MSKNETFGKQKYFRKFVMLFPLNKSTRNKEN